jgi:hypothetical protein
LAVAAAAFAAGLAAAPASAQTTWLCRPGLADNPCTPGLATTRLTPNGRVLGVDRVPRVRNPKIDCFYVYPTVSDDKGLQADVSIDPEERSIALYQASRYSRDCRVFAPMYRQITLAGIMNRRVTAAMRQTVYDDVRNAWRDYLAHDNHGRGFVLIGHSQGSFVLRPLIAQEIDAKPAVRRRLISALLLGGNVLVKKGSDVGGDFKHIRACHSATQLGCVIAFSTFNAPVPSNSFFGRPVSRFGLPPAPAGTEVLCTNPASLRGGSGLVTPIFPKAPFAPGSTIGAVTKLVGIPVPDVSTAWISSPGAYTARCSSANGAHVLQIAGRNGAPTLRAIPNATWGLHLTDANIALGNLAELVRTQAAVWARTTTRRSH